jgi:hypothetical protein
MALAVFNILSEKGTIKWAAIISRILVIPPLISALILWQ